MIITENVIGFRYNIIKSMFLRLFDVVSDSYSPLYFYRIIRGRVMVFNATF